MITYDKFILLQKKYGFDLSPCGVCPGKETGGYFCTPVGMTVIGWAGVDGIHYGQIEGFGEMVFAVSPMNPPGDYVHPLAENFSDFLRLLMACGDGAALEQSHQWKRSGFARFMQENPITEEQKSCFIKINEALSKPSAEDYHEYFCPLTPMEDPFDYMATVRKSFDYRKLTFGPDYEEWAPAEPKVPTAPQWEVCFGGGFFETKGHGRAGKEIFIGKSFDWGGSRWYVPAIYRCSDGIVLDLCVEASAGSIREFMDKWNLTDEYGSNLSEEEMEQASREHPLNVDVRAELTVDGSILKMSLGSGFCWIPKSCLPDGTRTETEAGWIADHYGLDRENGYGFHRFSFPWTDKKPKVIEHMELKLEVSPTALKGMRLTAPKVGDRVKFTHPISGVEHTLTIHSLEPQEISSMRLNDPVYEFPDHYTQMSYTLSPDLPNRRFSVRDCAQSDQPRMRTAIAEQKANEDGSFAGAIGIIGGADGPTAIYISRPARTAGVRTDNGGNDTQNIGWHIACSAVRFEPADSIDWKLEFREKLREDISVTLS